MEKFIGFVKALLTNRLGIVLAALNLCYFMWNGRFPLIETRNFDVIMICSNIPALVLSGITGRLVEFLFSASFLRLFQPFGVILFSFFITFQWLFIGWSAKMIARKIKQRGLINF